MQWTIPNARDGPSGPLEPPVDTEFRRALEDARRIEPSLSTDPADYFVESFRFKNELAGEGRVGMRLHSLMLGVRRLP